MIDRLALRVLCLLLPSTLAIACTVEGGDAASTGGLGAACYPNATCNAGLECVRTICVPASDDVRGGTSSPDDVGEVPDEVATRDDVPDGAEPDGAEPDGAEPDVPELDIAGPDDVPELDIAEPPDTIDTTDDTAVACPEHFTGEACDECAAHFMGEQCDECAAHFMGEQCDQCTHAYTGSACELCAPGYHACGESCVDDTRVTSCGQRCDACPQSPNTEALCQDGQCLEVCAASTADCLGGSACCTWRYDSVQGPNQTDAVALAVVDGKARVLWSSQSRIGYIQETASGWQSQLVTSDSYFEARFAFSASGAPIVVYFDSWRGQDVVVRLLGDAWVEQRTANVDLRMIYDIAVDAQDTVHLLYGRDYDPDPGRRYRSVSATGTWSSDSTIEVGDDLDAGQIALRGDGVPCAVYLTRAGIDGVGNTLSTIRYACKSADTWSIESVATGRLGDPWLAFDGVGTAHVIYGPAYGVDAGTLDRTREAAGWSEHVVNARRFPHVVIGPGHAPWTLGYWNDPSVHRWNGQAWEKVTVPFRIDGARDMAFDAAGDPWLVTADTDEIIVARPIAP